MAEAHDCVLAVLSHSCRRSSLSASFSYYLTHGVVQILQEASFRGRYQQEVVGQVIEKDRLLMVSHHMELDALIIINVQVFRLSSSKELVIVQEGDSSHSFLSLKFTE